MKRLSQYIRNINEWTLNNKSMKEIDKRNVFNAIEPDSSGVCLCLAVSKKTSAKRRIDIFPINYNFYHGTKEDYVETSHGTHIKNKLGYFVNRKIEDPWWLDILLFKKDALTFLNILLDDLEYEFDLSEMLEEEDNDIVNWPLPAKKFNFDSEESEPYSKDQIQYFISKIKKNK